MSNQANASKEVQAAAEISIDFDITTAHSLLSDMDSAVSDGNTAKEAKENASVDYCQFALSTYTQNAADTDERSGLPRDAIVKGFTAEMDAMRPMLAAEGNSFVVATVPEDGKGDTKYSWKGHGNNVKSIAKGVIEFTGIMHTDEDGNEYPAIINPMDAESFTEIKKSVEAARAYGEDENKRLLREAKEALRESCKLLIAECIKSDDHELIREESEVVDQLLVDWVADLEAQAALDREAQSKSEGESKVAMPAETEEDQAQAAQA
jgi:hypothetical protein